MSSESSVVWKAYKTEQRERRRLRALHFDSDYPEMCLLLHEDGFDCERDSRGNVIVSKGNDVVACLAPIPHFNGHFRDHDDWICFDHKNKWRGFVEEVSRRFFNPVGKEKT